MFLDKSEITRILMEGPEKRLEQNFQKSKIYLGREITTIERETPEILSEFSRFSSRLPNENYTLDLHFTQKEPFLHFNFGLTLNEDTRALYSKDDHPYWFVDMSPFEDRIPYYSDDLWRNVLADFLLCSDALLDALANPYTRC